LAAQFEQSNLLDAKKIYRAIGHTGKKILFQKYEKRMSISLLIEESTAIISSLNPDRNSNDFVCF